MADLNYLSTTQITTSVVAEPHKYPKYGKSTTDPTYYEPAATRIANMKKASGVKLEGIYDFYTKEDVSRFNENNFDINIRNVMADPRYNSNLLREEVSQINTNLADKVQKVVDDKKAEKAESKKRIEENIAVSKEIVKHSSSENNEE